MISTWFHNWINLNNISDRLKDFQFFFCLIKTKVGQAVHQELERERRNKNVLFF
jgi:hypothetical protein